MIVSAMMLHLPPIADESLSTTSSFSARVASVGSSTVASTPSGPSSLRTQRHAFLLFHSLKLFTVETVTRLEGHTLDLILRERSCLFVVHFFDRRRNDGDTTFNTQFRNIGET